MKTNRAFRTLQGQVRALLTKILHNTQDNKTAMFKQSILVKDGSRSVQHGCVRADNGLFGLLPVTFSRAEPEVVLRFYLYCKLRGDCTLLRGGGPPRAEHDRGVAGTSGWAPSQSGWTRHPHTITSCAAENSLEFMWSGKRTCCMAAVRRWAENRAQR